MPVTVFDRANVQALATGTLTTYDNQIDTTTGTFKLRATFANPDGALFPNQFVNVRLLVDTLTGAMLAPNAAVQLGATGNFVYLVKDDRRCEARREASGRPMAGDTVVTAGLEPGEKVVIDGVDRLRDGAKRQGRRQPAGRRRRRPDRGMNKRTGWGGGRRGPASSPSPCPVRSRRGLAGYGSGCSDRPAAKRRRQGAQRRPAHQSAPTPSAPAHGPAK